MRKLFKAFIARYLFFITRFALRVNRPIVIAIVGTSNKTLVKQVLVQELQHTFSVRTNLPQWNAEIGLPLSILNVKLTTYDALEWFYVLSLALYNVFNGKFPQILILELGFNKPGDMRYLSFLLKPQIVIITNMKPMYLENFSDDIAMLSKEFVALVKRLPRKKGLLIIENKIPEKQLLTMSTEARIIEYSLEPSKKSLWHIRDRRETEAEQIFTIERKDYSQTIKTHIPGASPRQAFLIAQVVKKEIKL